MFINLTAGTATLADVDNFKAFKVTTSLAPADIPSAIATAGRLDGTHVWINAAWLKAHGRPDDPAWLTGLDKMLDYAKGAGWVDEHGAVRAHIETL
jgi:hypothetical protein